MDLTQQKLDELEILKSVYPEKIEEDSDDVFWCQNHQETDTTHPILRFSIRFDQLHLSVVLPSGYPELEPSEVRIYWSDLELRDNKKVTDLIKSICNDVGECVIFQLVSEISDLLLDIPVSDKTTTEQPKNQNDDSLSRMWYYAHHIYSRTKRTNMLQWSKDLSLTGFILPGKPGIICIEGLTKFCKEFNSLVRAMNWQLLKLQHEENLPSPDCLKFDCFKEQIFEVHGRGNTHQNLGQFREFLEDIDLGNVFQILFNV